MVALVKKRAPLGLRTLAERDHAYVRGHEGVRLVLCLMSDTLLGNPDGELCKAAKMEDDGASALVTGVGNVDGVAEAAKSDLKTYVVVPWFRVFDKTGANVDSQRRSLPLRTLVA